MNIKKYYPVIKDGFILIVVATLFVVFFNESVKSFKKTNESDSLVTAIVQGNMKNINEILSQSEMEKSKIKYASIEEYLKARANKSDEFGRTPLMRLSYGNFSEMKDIQEMDVKRIEILPVLLTAGADVNIADNDGWTALMWAAWSGFDKTGLALIEKGADLNLTDKQGNTALMIAAQRGNAAFVKVLIEKGANKDLANKKGQKALDIAQESLKSYPQRTQLIQSFISIL